MKMSLQSTGISPNVIYLFRVKKRNTRTMCEQVTKLLRETPEKCHWSCSIDFLVNFQKISQPSSVFIVDFELVNLGWVLKVDFPRKVWYSFPDKNRLIFCCQWWTLCEMCPNKEFFLVRIFPHSDWIGRDTKWRLFLLRRVILIWLW